MAGTNLTGLRQVLSPSLRLKNIYGKILRMAEKLPRDAAYRVNTEAIVCHRLSIVEQTDDLKEIEETICSGTMETLVAQAQAEYDLCQNMIIWRCWEPLKQHPPPGQWRWPPVTG